MTSPHKRPVTQKMFPFDDVVMNIILYKRSVIELYTNTTKNNHNVLLIILIRVKSICIVHTCLNAYTFIVSYPLINIAANFSFIILFILESKSKIMRGCPSIKEKLSFDMPWRY